MTKKKATKKKGPVKKGLTAKGKKALAKAAKATDVAVDKSLDQLTMDELVALHNRHAGAGDAKVTKFRDKATAVRRTTSLLKSKGVAVPRKARAARKASTGGPRKGGGKMQKIRDLFKSRKRATIDEIVEASGFNHKNAACAMHILKNAARTKPDKMVVTTYDRKTKTYTRED